MQVAPGTGGAWYPLAGSRGVASILHSAPDRAPLSLSVSLSHSSQLAKRQKLNAALTKDVATASAATVAVMKKRGFYPLADKVSY